MKPYVVTFAGVPGTSKSIISQHLSCTFYIPSFANDRVRDEVKEEFLTADINDPDALAEYERRAATRRGVLFDTHKSFIIDSSVDRKWEQIKQQIQNAGYAYFLISMELSEEFMMNLYSKTNRHEAIDLLPHYMEQHQNFTKQFSQDISIAITDNLFNQRLLAAEEALQKFLHTL